MSSVTKRAVAMLLAVFLYVAVFPAAAQKAAAPSRTGSFPVLKFEKYKLPNGLEVILSEDHRLPLVAVNVWYHVGAANEVVGRTGFAHLFEHMMFEGSKHVGPKAHFRYLEAAGANDINGTTEFDRTNYFETLPSNQLELALWLESDRMGFLLPTLDQEKLANQRDVVRNERRQGLENVPYGLVEEEIYHQIFPKDHPYYAYVIGSHEDIEASRLDDVRKFFATYYSPGNASVAIVGDFQPEQAKQLVQKYFGGIKTGPAVPPVRAVTPPILQEKRVTVTDQIELPRVYMAWLMPPVFKPGDADADVLAEILGGGKSSRLYKKLVYEKQIAQNVNAANESALLASIFTIQATAKPGVKVEDLEKAINEEVEAIRKDGPTAEEIERARNKIQAQKIRRLELLGGFGGVADTLNRYNHYLQDPGFLPQDLKRYDNVTPVTAKALATDKLKDNERVVVYGVPGKKIIHDVAKTRPEDEKAPTEVAKDAGPEEAWRATAPKPGPLSRLTLPTPTSFKLSNGLTVLLVEHHSLPIVTANLVTLSGSELNPPDKPGLAAFTAAMLQEGTKNRSALKIADDVDQIGGVLNTLSTSDESLVGIRTLTRNEDSAFNLLSDLALNPAFDPKEIERVRSLRITNILQEKDDPNTLARKASYLELYGPKHPYGYLESGTEDSVKAITRDDLEKFWKTGYVPANSALVVAGDITQPELKKISEKYFGSWTGKFERPAPPAVTQKTTRQILIVDKPDAPQTAMRFGVVTVPRSTPDYASLEVMNTALGGLFSSRLNMNLREEHGYTYGAFSTVLFRRAPGPFLAVAGVRTDVTAPAVEQTYKEIDRMRETTLSADELTMAKNAFALSLAGNFETTAQTANTAGDLFVYDLPLNYYQTLPARIEAVTAADVQRVATTYLRPEAMVVVTVGDKAKIEPELKKLNAAPIAYRDYQGKPLPEKPAEAK